MLITFLHFDLRMSVFMYVEERILHDAFMVLCLSLLLVDFQ